MLPPSRKIQRLIVPLTAIWRLSIKTEHRQSVGLDKVKANGVLGFSTCWCLLRKVKINAKNNACGQQEKPHVLRAGQARQ
jgi:hypothetical protein